jgi:D-alanyl-D-alanine carboxypeptidase
MAARLHDALAAVVEGALADSPSVPGIVVAIDSAEHGRIDIARGVADPSTGAPLTPNHAARIASCTKTFVASTVLVLAGQGRVDLDQPIGELLAPDVAALWARFEHAAATTVRQLLQHRSGLVDHSTFPEFDAPAATQWTPMTQLAIAVDKPALFAPDEAFSYSDSGYVLLGQMIEHLTGGSLAAAVRDELHLDANEYPSIHWEVTEPTPTGLLRAHQLHFGVDTHDWNPSLDLFGGGGIVATMPDLARWWTALFADHVHPYLDVQTADPKPSAAPDGTWWPSRDLVGLGMFLRTVEGVDVWSHGGYWGLQTFHMPALQTSGALVITHRSTDAITPGVFADQVVRALLAA